MAANPDHTRSIEAEQAVLGGLILDNSHWPAVVERLKPSDFTRADHRGIFTAISNLARRGAPFDVVTLGDTLARDEVGKAFVDMAYLATLARDTPTAANTLAYAGIVLARSLRQQIEQAKSRNDLGTARKLQLAVEDLEESGWRPRSARHEAVFQSAAVLCESATAPRWVIKGLYEANTLNQIFGAPGDGKSALAIDQACHVAAGLPWNGFKVKQGPVLFICGEGHNGVARRVRAWCLHHDIDPADLPLYVSRHGFQLCDTNTAQGVGLMVDSLAESIGKPPVMVVIDTLARNFGADENSTADMSGFVANVDAYLRRKYEAAVLIVHHSGHGDKDRGRGSIALKGALDSEFKVSKTGDVVILETTKMKDGAPPPVMHFRFRSVNIGLADEDGDPVDSFVMESTDPPPPAESAKMSSSQSTMVEILSQLYEQRRDNLGNVPNSVPRVSTADWRDACLERGACPPKHFSDKIKRLQKRGLISVEGIYVYLAGEA